MSATGKWCSPVLDDNVVPSTLGPMVLLLAGHDIYKDAEIFSRKFGRSSFQRNVVELVFDSWDMCFFYIDSLGKLITMDLPRQRTNKLELEAEKMGKSTEAMNLPSPTQHKIQFMMELQGEIVKE